MPATSAACEDALGIWAIASVTRCWRSRATKMSSVSLTARAFVTAGSWAIGVTRAR